MYQYIMYYCLFFNAKIDPSLFPVLKKGVQGFEFHRKLFKISEHFEHFISGNFSFEERKRVLLKYLLLNNLSSINI